MLPHIKEIKMRRKQLGLTQNELAEKAGVSQSLITKIEAGKLIPSYEKAKKLFDVLESIHEETKPKLRDIMTKKVVSVKAGAKLRHAVYVMKKYNISQLPVAEDGGNLGTISESSILERMRDADKLDISGLECKDVMDDPLPIVHQETPLGVVSSMLDHFPAVLVGNQGKFSGIITKTDLLNTLLKGR